MRAAALASLAFTALAFAPSVASAYCRTASCPNGKTGAVCVPAQSSDCGVPLAWPSPCVTFSLQQDASVQVPLAQVEQVFGQAFAQWTGADCGGGANPRIRVRYTGPVECAAHEYNQDAGNANIVLFQDAEWPHPSKSTLALTTVTYNLDNGQIYDADMELNSATVVFSVSDTTVTYDLQSVVTHETGHFLGISHSSLAEATMRPDYVPGSIGLRDLDVDDVAAICAAYPPGAPIPATCDDTPRHGFSGLCGDDQPIPSEVGSSCAVGSAGSAPGGSARGLAFALALAGLVVGYRRRQRSVC